MTFDAKAFAVQTARDTFRTPEADIAHAIAVVERELAIEAAQLAIRARNDDLFTRAIRRIWQQEPA